jgi:hypothetical protein
MPVSSTSGRSAARLNEVGRATVDDAREFVRPYAEQFPQIYSNYGFDARLPERKLIWISIQAKIAPRQKKAVAARTLGYLGAADVGPLLEHDRLDLIAIVFCRIFGLRTGTLA